MDYGWNFITEYIALGGEMTSEKDVAELKAAGIIRVINCREICDPLYSESELVTCWPNPRQPDDGKPRGAQWFREGVAFWRANPHGKLYIHCFPEDTILAQEVPTSINQAGNSVFGHDGKLHRVVRNYSRHYQGDLLKFQIAGLPPIRCTPEHPFLIVRPYRYPSGFSAKPSFEREAPHKAHLREWFAGEPGWLPASKIQPGDFFVAPRPVLSDERTAPNITPHSDNGNLLPVSMPEWSDDLVWFFGLYIADGSADGNGISLCLATKDDHDRCCRVAASFGVTPRFRDYGNYKRVGLSSRTLSATFKAWFGADSHTKHIPDFLMRSWAAAPLIEGVTDGDGTRSAKGNIISTTSLTLAHQLRLLLLNQRKYPTLVQVKRATGFANAAPIWNVHWREAVQHQTCWFGDLYCQAVTNISAEQFEGNVFNLEVEDVHSYLAGGVTAHNCHAGLNRSASMVYAILRVMGLKPKDARALIVANRPMDIVGVRYADEADSVIACL